MRNRQILSIVGARPQFVKAAVVSRAFESTRSHIEESIVHTGQHFDTNMSEVFFEQMGIPKPAVNLGIGGMSHGAMTGAMLSELEKLYQERRPAAVLVYGDTNSTLAGALAASKLHIPVLHVEAGLRSYNKRMPEEQNRVLTDHLSDLLLAPTAQAVQNLEQEGISQGVIETGDVMYDAALYYAEKAVPPRGVKIPHRFALMTLHRAENTDDPQRLKSIVEAVNSAVSMTVILPLHPRTRKVLQGSGLALAGHVQTIEPVGYLEMVYLETRADRILTDSGGVQKEAYFFEKPCGTMRDETEWVETVAAGANTLLGADGEAIRSFLGSTHPEIYWPPLYGDGHAGEAAVSVIEDLLS